MEYELELDRVVKEITQQKAKRVLVQLPDGLKPRSKDIVEVLRKKTKAEVIIWLESCYGACDIPKVDKAKVDLMIQWGHSSWK